MTEENARASFAMIDLEIPGLGRYELQHLVLDVNGTIARDGSLLPGVQERLGRLSVELTLHLITADTHGRQEAIDRALGLTSVRISPGLESAQKGRYVRHLGAAGVAAIGNGANDVDMLRSAAIGIAVLGEEGLAGVAAEAADLLAADVNQALDLLCYPQRLVATLRR